VVNMNRCLLTTITIIVITVMAFTACNKKSETQTDFTIYSVWRHIGGADVEHGETWTSDGVTTFSFFKDGENVYYTSSESENSIWQGVLDDMGDFRYAFNPHTQINLDTGTYFDFKVQGPTAWIDVRYDSENKRLISSDHTVEQYYVWAGEPSRPDPRIFSFTAAASSPQSQTAAADISAFMGTWVNSEGRTYKIPQPHSWENEFPGGFKQFENYFHWGHPAGDFGIYLVPAGVDLILHGNVLLTDATKMRLITEDLHSAPVVYYREGEVPPVSESINVVLGTWMFESGGFVYFFGQSPSIHFLPDKTVNVYEQGDQYLRLARSGIWGFTPEGQLFVEFDWNTYLFTCKSDGEDLIIIDSDGNRSVFGKVYG